MFKNRIRTAAIAGIAALATGLGAVVVPASAQDTVEAPGAPAGQYWVDQDASAAFDATPVDHSEEELKGLTDQTQAFIQEGVANEWRNLHSNLNYDPSEEARAADIRAIHEDIVAAQQVNSDNIKRIQESIAYAYDQDKAAADAWQALVERAHEINQELNARDKAPVANNQTQLNGSTYGPVLYIPSTITDVNDESTRKPFANFSTAEKWTILEAINFYAERDGSPGISGEALATLQTDLGSNPSDQAVQDYYVALLEIVDHPAFQEMYDQLGNFLFDNVAEEELDENGEPVELEDGQRYSRYAAKLIVELFGEVEDYVAELDGLIDASEDASREAQQSDVLVRQGFLIRALAQREVLRNAEGFALASYRYYELYNDDTFTGDRTLLSTEYRRVLDNLWGSLVGGTFEDIDENTVTLDDEYIEGSENRVANYPLLTAVDGNVVTAFDEWSVDLNTNADVIDIREGIYSGDWDFQIIEERIDTSAADYARIVANGKNWREALNRVSALEKEIAAPSDYDNFLDRLEEILAGDDADNGEGNGNPDDDGSITGGGSSIDAPSIDGGSSDLGGFGIAAVIAAIIGVLALVVPNIQNFL